MPCENQLITLEVSSVNTTVVVRFPLSAPVMFYW